MIRISDVKLQSDEPESFMFKWIFDILSINLSFDSIVHDKRHKSLKSDMNQDQDLKATINKIVGWKAFSYGLSFSIVDSLCRILQPQLVGEMISCFTLSLGNELVVLYAASIILCSLVSVLAFRFFSLSILNIGKKISIASCSMLYSKVLQLKQSATHSTLKGELMNFMSDVSPKFNQALSTSHEMYRAPLEAAVIGILVYREMRMSGLIGVSLLLAVVPFFFWVTKQLETFSKKLETQSGKRVQLVTEIIRKIKSVKTFCLEQPLAKRIKKIRNREIKSIGRSFLYSSAICFLNFLVKISIFVCLASFSNAGNRYNSRNVYVVISYYNLMAHSVLKCWPRSVANSREVTFLLEKVLEFIQSDDNILSKFHFVDKTSFHEDANATNKFSETMKLLEKRVVNKKLCGNSGIFMRNVLLASRNEDTFELRCDYLELNEPKTYGVEDFTNLAKDFLFQIILGELEVDSGEIEINGKISFASQSPCFIPGSLRENIVCGEPFDEERYKAIIEICKLRKDLEVMDAGDGCCIDESAKNLSFKAKINLARCLYRKADIYVFDDPFGTFSFETSKCIFNNAIKKLLKNKMCIVATKHQKLLDEIDDVIFISNGCIGCKTRAKSSKEKLNCSALDFIKVSDENKCRYSTYDSFNHNNNQQIISSKRDQAHINNQQNSRFINNNERNVYKLFTESINNRMTLLAIGFLFMFAQFSSSAIDLFLSTWIKREESNRLSVNIQLSTLNDTFNENQGDEKKFDYNYGDWINYGCFYFIALCLLFYLNFHRSFLFFKTCLRASVNIHDKLFCGITRASLKFFECNSTDKMLELFSTAIATIDYKLPQLFHDSIVIFLEFLAILIVINIVVNYWLVFPTLFMVLLIAGLQFAYVKASRNLQRHESITRNSIYSHIAATSRGLSTIHSTRSEELFLNEFHQRLYLNTSTVYLFNVAATKIAFWQETVCLVYVFVAAMSFVVFGNKVFNGADVGLAMTHVLQLMICCREGIRQMMELKNQINSAKRVFDYEHVKLEPPLCTANKFRPLKDWPQNAEIVFTNFHMKLTPDGDYKLKDISFKINAGEKIGIMGDERASIVEALYRFGFNEGSIEIDDINIETLGLHDLRRAFSLIPPEPVLFSGTLRSNLDPFDEKTDDEIWEALEHVQMKNAISMLDNGLTTEISSGCCAFSITERQLFCLARAILGANRILIFEDSSKLSSDLHPENNNMDDLIKEVIHKKFTSSTIIKIACRLDSVMDCDKIIVLECGHIVEFGHPYELIQTSRGYFRSFLDESGYAKAMNLIKIAEKNYFLNRNSTN